MTTEAFKKGMASIILAFPNRTFDNNFLWDYLQDLSDEEFLHAVSKVISEHKELFPGTNIIALLREKARVSQLPSAGEAWAEVRSEVSRVGMFGCPKFRSALIQKAAFSIGWRDICMSENPSVERAHFLKIYDSLVRREQENQLKLPQGVILKMLEKNKP